MKRKVAGSLILFFLYCGESQRELAPKIQKLRGTTREETSSSQVDQGALPQADHNKSQSDSAAPDDSTSNSKS